VDGRRGARGQRVIPVISSLRLGPEVALSSDLIAHIHDVISTSSNYPLLVVPNPLLLAPHPRIAIASPTGRAHQPGPLPPQDPCQDTLLGAGASAEARRSRGVARAARAGPRPCRSPTSARPSSAWRMRRRTSSRLTRGSASPPISRTSSPRRAWLVCALACPLLPFSPTLACCCDGLDTAPDHPHLIKDRPWHI
jgi:hypothetical protein